MTNVDDETALRDLPRRLAAAETDGSPVRATACFTDDAIVMEPDYPLLIGARAIRSFYEDVFQQTRMNVSAVADEVQIAGPWAYIRISARVEKTNKADGSSQEATGKGIWIAKKQKDASWRLFRTAFNFDI